MDDDGLLAAGVPGRAADVDGRAGRRSGDHAADRQAGRDPGALAQRGRGGRDRRSALASLLPRIRTAFAATVLERVARPRLRRRRCGSRAWLPRRHIPAEPDPRRRGTAAALIGGRRARRIVDSVEAELLTPSGSARLRPASLPTSTATLAGPSTRDAAYHQGTVWPWLLGPFVEAWVRTHGNDDDARCAARKQFFEPLPRTFASPDSVTSRRSPSPARHSTRAAVPSRHGRSASTCVSNARFCGAPASRRDLFWQAPDKQVVVSCCRRRAGRRDRRESSLPRGRRG